MELRGGKYYWGLLKYNLLQTYKPDNNHDKLNWGAETIKPYFIAARFCFEKCNIVDTDLIWPNIIEK